MSLILTARRADRLEALAAQLRTQHDIDIQCMAADLADPAGAQKLHAQIQDRGLIVDILINNAGYGVPGHFHALPWQTHADFLQVMVTAPCELVRLVLPGMRERGWGRIINVASLAGFLPGSAGQTLYAAAKSFLIKFSQSLALENAARGVNVCALCPGFTYSEFHDVTGTRALVAKMPNWLWLDAEHVVRLGLDAVERGEVTCVTGRANRVIKSLSKLMPDRLALYIMRKQSKKFRGQHDDSKNSA